MGRSLCAKEKELLNQIRCKKVKGCKVASGKKRTFCRKKHNKSARKTRKVRKYRLSGI